MTARAGMGTVIADLRLLTFAGTADYTVAGTAYFTDDQLQNILDKHRATFKRVEINSNPTYADGAYTYTEYRIPQPLGHWFETDETDSGWNLADSTGADAPAHTVAYSAGMITFSADTTNLPYYLDCRTYDVNAAAADVWEMKSSLVANDVNWSSDNHRIDAGAQIANFQTMAKKYRGLSGGGMGSAKMIRTDER